MTAKRRIIGAILVILLVAGTTVVLLRHRLLEGKATNEKLTDNVAPRSSAPTKQENLASNSTTERLDECVSQIAAAKDPETSRRILAELRAFLDSLPRETASRAIQDFLSTLKNADTKLDLTIKAGGALGDPSSLRVFLLDYLGQIDPAAAGEVAARILSAYTTPDEWAVSLRNYAWANQGEASIAYLMGKARELLLNANWRRSPTAGFLQAFDTIVYTRGTALTPELAGLVRDKDNPATAHAAYLTLDRLTIAAPTGMLKALIEQPELMKGREQTRANFVARADVRDPDQRALLERYLMDRSRTREELATFAGLYPNANYMISDNLLTTVQTPTGSEISAGDRQALEIVSQWQSDPRFAHLRSLLTQIRERLRNFVHDAGDSQ